MKSSTKFWIFNGLFALFTYLGITGVKGGENLVKFGVVICFIMMVIGVLCVHIPNDEIKAELKKVYKPRSVPKNVVITVGILFIIAYVWSGWFITGLLAVLTEYLQCLFHNKYDEINEEIT